MGRNIYFTDRELSMARDYVFEATDILGNASDTAEQVDEDMENGLGSALRKLYTKAVLENQNTQSIKQNEDKNIFNPIEKKLEEMKNE